MWERFSSLSNQEKKNKKLKIPILNNFNFFFFIINIPESKWKESVWEKGHFFYYIQINGHKNIWMRRKNIEKLIIISKEISMIFLSLLLFLSVVKRKLPRCCIATPMTRNTEWFRRIHVFFLRIGTCSIWSWRFTHVFLMLCCFRQIRSILLSNHTWYSNKAIVVVVVVFLFYYCCYWRSSRWKDNFRFMRSFCWFTSCLLVH